MTAGTRQVVPVYNILSSVTMLARLGEIFSEPLLSCRLSGAVAEPTAAGRTAR